MKLIEEWHELYRNKISEQSESLREEYQKETSWNHTKLYNAQQHFSSVRIALKKYSRKLFDLYVQKYIEVYTEWNEFPDENDLNEFTQELSDMADARIRELEMASVNSQSATPRSLIDSQIKTFSEEVKQEIGLAIIPLRTFITKGKIEMKRRKENETLPESEKKYETLDLTGALTPSSMTRGMLYPYDTDDIKTEEDYQRLIMLMFRFPNRDFYLYQERNGARNEIILKAEKLGEIEFGEIEFFHYRHPPNSKNYVHLEIRDGKYEWPWQREAIESGPMYIQTTLHLSTRKRMEIETWHKVQMEEALRKKLAEALNTYDVFISYSSIDAAEADRLYEAVKQAGGKPFLSAKELTPGDTFADKIRDALIGSKELWLLVSPTSLKSDWVLSEWGAAWALKKTIVPILHQCAAQGLPDRLKGLHCIDFYRYPDLISQRVWGNTSP